MIRSTRMLFCDEDHNVEQTFPCINDLDENQFINPPTAKQLRAMAKPFGWSYRNGRDHCDLCTTREAEDELPARQQRLAQ